MLVALTNLVALYLKGAFPNETVSRVYEIRTALDEVSNLDTPGRRIYVAPPLRTGNDTILSRNTTIEREVGVTVALFAKTNGFSNEECDPLLDLSEKIREKLWQSQPFHLGAGGYGKAVFVRLTDAVSGRPTEARIFEAAMTPFYKIIHNLSSKG